MPLLARWPGRLPAGKVNDEFVSSLEFFPTFSALAGAPPPPGVVLDGFNALPVYEGKAKSQRKDFFWHRPFDNSSAARVGQWKWVRSKGGGGLFDLGADLGEKQDLSAEKPDVLRRVEGRYAAWWREMQAAEPRGPFRDY